MPIAKELESRWRRFSARDFTENRFLQNLAALDRRQYLNVGTKPSSQSVERKHSHRAIGRTLFGALQQRRSLGVYTSTPVGRFQFTSGRRVFGSSCLFQPLGVLWICILCLAFLVVAIAEAERVVVIWFGMWCNRSQGLPLLAA